jgi:hypothetical protein
VGDPANTPLQTVANISAIIAGAAAVATLVLVWLDRRTRIKLDFRIDDRERVYGEGRRHYAVFEVANKGRSRVRLLQWYLAMNSRGDRFYDFDSGPGQGAGELLPEEPPAEMFVRMDKLARALVDAGAVFTAEVKFVVEDGDRKLHERTVVIHNLQRWARAR